MSYTFDQDQLDAIDRLINDIHDFLTFIDNSEEANEDTFNARLNEIQGVLAYLKENTGVGVSELDDLTDVVLTTPVSGQVLTFDGANWVNDDVTSGGGGGGVTFATYQLDIASDTSSRIDQPLSLDRIYNVENMGDFIIYLGNGSGVTSLTGFGLEPGDVFETILAPLAELHAIAEFGIVHINVMRGHVD